MTLDLPDRSYLNAARHFLGYVALLVYCCFSLPALAQTPLSLPFFDDFSTNTRTGVASVDQPDPSRWQPGSGVYLNNTMSINHPTVGMASFDGLAANGLPYVRNNQFGQGYTDTLTSRPINLAGLAAADSVYLSFYWQIRGLGELPDAGDSLTVQFLDRTGAWQTVWTVEGGLPNNNFPQAFIPIQSATYLHGAFAFRFRSYGRSSGPFDTWNVDYVYLNRGRTRNDRFVKDVAVRQPLSPLLKRYTAMPLAQYQVNPAAETADSVTTDINNLFNNFNFTTFRFSVRDEVSGRIVQEDPQTNTALIPSLSSQRKSARPAPVTSLGTATRAVLRYRVDLLTTDDQNPSIPGVNLRRNDTISSQAVLDNYYAYDDGTWEFGLQIGPRERVAVRYILNKPDVISGVRAVIVPFRTNQTGQPFVLSVFSNRNGVPGSAIYQKSFTTQYGPYRNAFVEFKFDKGVAVTDTFYVGYQQISTSDTTFLRLGVDKNSPFSRQIFYSGGTDWAQNGSLDVLNVQGAFMLRPVMGGAVSNVVTAITEPEPLSPLVAYPNPTAGFIRWESTRLTRLEVMSVGGRLLHSIEPGRGQQTADLSYLADGIYLLRLIENERTVVQKLIISH
jgi:hypothetical protein